MLHTNNLTLDLINKMGDDKFLRMMYEEEIKRNPEFRKQKEAPLHAREFAADCMGVIFMEWAGFDPAKALSAAQKVWKFAENPTENLLPRKERSILNTHPEDAARDETILKQVLDVRHAAAVTDI